MATVPSARHRTTSRAVLLPRAPCLAAPHRSGSARPPRGDRPDISGHRGCSGLLGLVISTIGPAMVGRRRWGRPESPVEWPAPAVYRVGTGRVGVVGAAVVGGGVRASAITRVTSSPGAIRVPARGSASSTVPAG